jgi:TonB-dependent SusC/RagA subfamily outer membrane receptor
VDGILLQNGTPDLNPSDIENIEVVKGAAAASLYGARAGGGVINITTKTGRTASEGIKIGARSEYGRSDIPHEFSIAQQTFLPFDPTGQFYCAAGSAGGSQCARFINMQTEAQRINDVSSPQALTPQSFLYDAGIAANPGRYRLLNMFQAMTYPATYDQIAQATKTDQFTTSNVDLRGKVGTTGFFASASHSKQAGAFQFLNGYQRNSGRLNVDQLVGSKLALTATSFYAATVEDGSNQEGGTGFFRLSRSPAFVNQSLRDSQGRLYIRSDPLNQGSQNANPLYYLEQYDQQINGTRFLGSMQARYTLTDWAEANADFAYDRGTGFTTWLEDRGFRTTDPTDVSTPLGFIQNSTSDNRSLNTSAGLTLRPHLLDVMTTTFTGSVLYDAQRLMSQTGYGENLTVPGLLTLNAASLNKDILSSRQDVRSLSYRAGSDFELLDRYILSLSVRREGSSLFGSNQRWSTFPRVAGAWIASSEPWWKVPALSLAKLRAAWGKAGQRPSFAAQYETYTVDRTNGRLTASTIGNPDLRPEILTETELGADLELLGRYALSLTYAHSLADDQILQVPVPAVAGFQTQWQNAGQLENKTWEASLDIPLVQRSNVRWSTRLIYDRNRAVITRLDVPPYTTTGGVQGSESMFFVRQGERLGTIYGRAFVTDCSQLPAPFNAQCGGGGSQFQKNNDGFIVWTGGVGLGEGVTSNAWNAYLNSKSAPWGIQAGWGMPMQLRDSVGSVAQVALGNATPSWHGGLSSNFSFGKASAYGLLDGSFGRKVWNEGYHWALGDFMSGTVDQGGQAVSDAKPIGYYYRAGPGVGGSSGVGGLYNVLGPTNQSVEDASYVKLREVSVNYNIGAVGGQGNWTVGLVGRNLHTWTKYRGYDPEVGRAGGTQLNNSSLVGVDYFTFPNLRTFTLQVSTAF